MTDDAAQQPGSAPKWRPLTRIQRRVAGVLIEKAKTTPDAYPMSLNALANGCNQKSNRHPQMNLSPDDVEQALEEMRGMGAAAEVQAGGRVPKYRHYLYEWLGVDKTEIAVMGELLLRGEQTVGELRGRAARMEPVADLAALRPVLNSLIEKKLVVALTPEGRGQVVTHALYLDSELDALRAKYSGHQSTAPPATPEPAAVRTSPPASTEVSKEMFAELQHEVARLRSEVARLQSLVQETQQRG